MPTEIVLNIHTPLAIAGIVIGLIAIGLFVWLRKDQNISNDLHEAELNHTHQGMNAMMNDFNNYQVETDRKIAELEKQVEWLPKNTDRKIENFRKDLPKEIRGVIGHIEFSQNNLR